MENKFIRSLTTAQIMAIKKDKLFTEKLLYDIKKGEIFPAIRKDEVYFYYDGAVLFRFTGMSFTYNKQYWCGKESGEKTLLVTEKTLGISFSDEYDNLKSKCLNYSKSEDGSDKICERKLLSRLNSQTFSNPNADYIVLDIEININISDRKKCDMILLSKKTAELLFVEGKTFSDSRIYGNSEIEVISQVESYSNKASTYQKEIVMQYQNYIKIVNNLFQTNLPNPQILQPKAKLLVYQCNIGNYDIKKRITAGQEIDTQLCGNVLWCYQDETPTLEEIFHNVNEYSSLPSRK